ncbi:aldose 1-epimerase family protein [Novosphingobium album (ex Hu et al. 2023)]|uniref:Aldose 1-epimerase family protein n=1 Tax=Novosphingobium album (ex Hu et al. 2023) TaxID=2930093 RepID=A0ABT0B6U4_9SPHN|nr:aldose 1-epimerase family protein [Novosphingobium album (ex Hu et al. 2023)]MCJ2180775.1 aldose 1-epimerase family protein [Novosphingobium album (ex Hu et al. 2023)]
MEFVTISSGDLTARINPFGAELWSLTDAHGREFMTAGDPAFWSGHAPLLFPIVGGLAANRYRVDGQEYELPRHGFARRSPFELMEAGECSARFRLRDSAETRAVYPFAFELEMAFVLDGTTLHMTATVRNPGDTALPFSFGYHPAFAWPLPGGSDKADHVIAFSSPETQRVRRLDPASGLMLPDAEPTPVEGHHLALDAALFEADAMIWDELVSRSLTFGTPGGAQLAIGFPDTPMLGIWQKPGAPFLCIEPWQGHADPVGFSCDFREKPGIVNLESGDARAFRMDVTVLPAD